MLYVGLCLEDYWPYNVAKVFTRPTNSAYTDAKLHRVNQNIDDIRQCLANGYPVIFGFVLFNSFNNIGHDGIMPMPSRTEAIIGEHAVAAVGYDDNTKFITIRNSWGQNWGNNGYFYMPYDFITNPYFASDFWTITAVQDDNLRNPKQCCNIS